MALYKKKKQLGNKGESEVEAALSENALVHRIDGSKDIGLDMLCEWVSGEESTQLLFGVQVKTRSNANLKLIRKQSSLNLLKEFSVSANIQIEEKTLNYWRGFDFPVFLFLVDGSDWKIYYKRYTPILHGLTDSTNEPFYQVTNDDCDFLAYVHGYDKTGGFCRDLFIDHLRCQHNKGLLSGIDPEDLGLRGWKNDVLYEKVYDQYLDKITGTFNKYRDLLDQHLAEPSPAVPESED